MNHRPLQFALALVLASLASLAQAQLRPSEIAIIAVRGSRESERLAEYYAEQRKIPAENICLVVMPKGETLDREKWQWAVRPEIRKWLEEKDPDGELRCLVTTWDVPLRIGPDKKDSPALLDYQDYLTGERAKRIALLRDITKEFEVLAPGVALTETNTDQPADAAAQQSELDNLQKRLEQELQDAQSRIRQLTDPQEQQVALGKVQQYATLVGGVQVLAQSLQGRLQQEQDNPELTAELERLRGMMLAYLQMQQQLDSGGPRHRARHAPLGSSHPGRWSHAKHQMARRADLRSSPKTRRAASFDSELSLVMWPDDYQLLRWQPNYLRPDLRSLPTPTIVPHADGRPDRRPHARAGQGADRHGHRGREAKGSKGKVYLDARGIGKLDQTPRLARQLCRLRPRPADDGQGIRRADRAGGGARRPAELFQPGDCPDAALYCGWYSLAKYVDAFDWAPGAVAYHLASSEATTLRNEQSQVWCKRMLEDGVCATIGPVYEPYLVAFPRPNEFFALLHPGRALRSWSATIAPSRSTAG